jgi:hypothetical protein
MLPAYSLGKFKQIGVLSIFRQCHNGRPKEEYNNENIAELMVAGPAGDAGRV